MSFHEIFEKSRLGRSQDKSPSPTKDNEPDTSPDADDFYFWGKISTYFSMYFGSTLVTQHETLLLVIFAGPTIIIPV